MKVQTIGVIDYGPVDNGDPGRNTSSHALMLFPQGHRIDFVTIPRADLIAGKPVWTANQLSDNSEIFIYVPSGKCLADTPRGKLALTHCNLAPDQRWRPLNGRVLQNQVIAQYRNAETSRCLTAPQQPGPAITTTCGPSGTKTQEIAFWWSA
jgi:hypothetical protein